MDLNTLLDTPIAVEDSPMPTLREIIEKHFATYGGPASVGKIVAREYIQLLTIAAGPAASGEAAKGPADKPQPAADEPRKPSDAENLLKSIGLPIGEDGRLDLQAAFSGAISPDGPKTPVGVLLGGLLRTMAEGAKPKA